MLTMAYIYVMDYTILINPITRMSMKWEERSNAGSETCYRGGGFMKAYFFSLFLLFFLSLKT